MIKKLLVNLHKILGLLLSGLFLMWFLSGFVMIYHSFPRVSPQNRIEKQNAISGNLPAAENIESLLSDTTRLQSLSLEMYFDRPALHFRGRGVPANIYADSFLPLEEHKNSSTIRRTAGQWCDAPILNVDTLQKLDQWIPFGQLKKEFPIYKFTFADAAKHQLYISSQSGRVLQYTDKNQRFWAWLGAIPHWVYFTTLRQEQSLWSNFVKWTSGIGCIMCLTGIILAIQITWQNRRKGLKVPYKKRWFRWHYISGLIFGIFAITFAFSGLMSMTDLPEWLKKKPKSVKESAAPPPRRGGIRGSNGTLSLETFQLDYRLIVETTPGIKSLEWATYQGNPYYKVTTDNGTTNIDASGTQPGHLFMLTEEMVHTDLKQIYGDSIPYSVTLISEYDDYYYSRKKQRAPLPVYRAIVEDEMHTRHYYNPKTLSQQRIDDNTRIRKLLYGGFHSLNFKFLTDRPVLWNILMFTLLIGGSFLSFTGVVLSVKWIIRKVKKIIRKRK